LQNQHVSTPRERGRSRLGFGGHWDGKMMKNSTNPEDQKSMADRLAVSITGYETEKILGIVKLTSGTGVAQASATLELKSNCGRCPMTLLV